MSSNRLEQLFCCSNHPRLAMEKRISAINMRLPGPQTRGLREVETALTQFLTIENVDFTISREIEGLSGKHGLPTQPQRRHQCSIAIVSMLRTNVGDMR